MGIKTILAAWVHLTGEFPFSRSPTNLPLYVWSSKVERESIPLDLVRARSLSDSAFVTRRRRCGQLWGRRPGKTGGVFGGIHWGFFLAEHDADGRGSFAPV